MPYGRGRTSRSLDRSARQYAATDDQHTYVVTTDRGAQLTVTGINSAKAVAGRSGTYRRK